MKPPPFTYHRPENRSEVDSLLAELGSDAKILAGGQSLVPILNMRLAQPQHVIDINHLDEESSEPTVSNGHLSFTPLVRQHVIESSVSVAERVPLLTDVIDFVAHPAIRSRGTVVGSVAHADPAAELPAAFVALDGEIVARGKEGGRVIPAGEFYAGPFENTLTGTEWVEEVRWPVARAGEGYAFDEFARRRGDYALCGVAAVAEKQGNETTVALTYLGMGEKPVRLQTESFAEPDTEEAVATLVHEHLQPGDDVHAGAGFRMHLARVLGAKAARRALARASES